MTLDIEVARMEDWFNRANKGMLIRHDPRKRTKDKNLKVFIKEKTNRDPWGEAYKFFRGNKGRKEIAAGVRNQNGQMTRTWKETVSTLLEGFFPPSRDEATEFRRDDMEDLGGR